MDFDNHGEWNEYWQRGPAIHAPDVFKNIVVNQCRIEWLNLSPKPVHPTDFLKETAEEANTGFKRTSQESHGGDRDVRRAPTFRQQDLLVCTTLNGDKHRNEKSPRDLHKGGV